MTAMRRDFRWIRVESDITEPCKWPWFKLPFGLVINGADCAQISLWTGQKLTEVEGAPGKYSAIPPAPMREGHWIGYYIEVYFEADTDLESFLLHNHFAFTSPGYVWPNTFPYPDCDNDCEAILV